jgi:hypothetical protein
VRREAAGGEPALEELGEARRDLVDRVAERERVDAGGRPQELRLLVAERDARADEIGVLAARGRGLAEHLRVLEGARRGEEREADPRERLVHAADVGPAAAREPRLHVGGQRDAEPGLERGDVLGGGGLELLGVHVDRAALGEGREERLDPSTEIFHAPGGYHVRARGRPARSRALARTFDVEAPAASSGAPARGAQGPTLTQLGGATGV